MSLGLNCTTSHVNVLRRTPEGCTEASQQKINCTFSIVFFLQTKQKTEFYPADKMKDEQLQQTKKTYKKTLHECFLSKFCYCSKIWHSIFEFKTAPDNFHLLFKFFVPLSSVASHWFHISIGKGGFIFTIGLSMQLLLKYIASSSDFSTKLFFFENVCYFLNNQLKRCFFLSTGIRAGNIRRADSISGKFSY